MKSTKANILPFLPIIGGFLIHLTLGTLQSFGNLLLYTTSYMREIGGSSTRYKDMSWIYSCAIITQEIFIFLGSKFEERFGQKLTVLIGGWMMCLGYALSYFTVYDFWFFLFTYGIIVGVGSGVCYTIPLACALRWMPNSKILVTLLICFGRGLAVFLCTIFQTYFVNPNNLRPTSIPYENFSNEKYFSDTVLLERVPQLFLYMGAIFSIFHLFGALTMLEKSDVICDEGFCPDECVDMNARIIHDNSKRDIGSYDDQKLINGCSNNIDYGAFPRNSYRYMMKDKVLTPFEILGSSYFWYLWVMMLCTWQAVGFTQSYWKVIGSNLINIQSDKLLSYIGSLASLSNTLGRVLWGHFAYKCGHKISLLCMPLLITLAISMITYLGVCGTSYYALWISILSFGNGGSSSVFFPIITDFFGTKNFGVALGLLLSSRFATCIISSILVSLLADSIGFYGLCNIISLITAFSILLAILFHPNKFVTIGN